MDGSPALAKKIPQQLATLLREHTAAAVGAVIEPVVRRQQLEDASAGAALGIRRPEQDPIYPCLDDRSGAHRAWLEGDVEFGSGQPVVAEMAASVS